MDSDSSSETDGDDGGAGGGGPQLDGLQGEDDDSVDDHFLERELDTASAALRFVGEGMRSTSDTESDDADTTGAQSNADTGSECGCSLGCLAKFDPADIEQSRLSMAELGREEKELVLLGLLESARYTPDTSTHGKKRKRQRFCYSYQEEKICAGAFRFVYGLGK